MSVYVAAPLCEGARAELAAARGRAGEVRVRAICLTPVRAGRRLDLATVGSNARRATEDSSTVAYIGDADRAAVRFTRPILDEAGIALLTGSAGGPAMTRLLTEIEAADPSSGLRESLRESLG